MSKNTPQAFDSPTDDWGHRRWSQHPPRCFCAGRGWFVEHLHNDGCDDDECVGCRKVYVRCEYEWCGQCNEPTTHATNRCPTGPDVRCLTHERWMKRGAKDCTDERFGSPPPDSRPCKAAS